MTSGSDYIDRKLKFSGRFGDVFQSIQKSTGAVVALKIVDQSITVEPHCIVRETTALKRVNHPNVLAIIDSYICHDDHVMVSRYYDYTLDQLLHKNLFGYSVTKTSISYLDPGKMIETTTNTLPPDLIRSFLKGLFSGIAHLHHNGIIHRDIKPANILFTGEGPDPIAHPVLADLGTCYDHFQNMKLEQVDKKCVLIATGIYKPIEACLCQEKYGYEVDLWQVGILMTVLFLPSLVLVLQSLKSGEPEPYINDISLVALIYKYFGTPVTTKDTDPYNFWPDMHDPMGCYDGANFGGPFPRQPPSVLVPRCDDTSMIQVFKEITRYDAKLRPSADQCVAMLEGNAQNAA